ncbi:hypothetical protein H9638_16365 [Arthrobacter sp. Sa2BUA2]|uniref:Uncharacterized protein n=1 Tax=Arthrobacter pullicola TaxID=2762224 RepID=A0ABR8YMV8_9MICC|nr:hypothetical protein [Arthrobacter pullicola]MBD8045383.1 hypothetical protein [Arthrobacter pullicola]
MRKTAAIPVLTVLALLLVTGCSAANAEAEAQPSPPPSSVPAEPSTEAAVEDTEEQACLKLLGTDGQGPLHQVMSVLRIGDGTSGVEMSAEDARPLHEEVLAIAKDAPADLGPLLRELSSATGNVIMQAEKPGRAWTFNTDTWTAAVTELEERCAPYGAAA